MDAERWQHVERLYDATLECEESQRAAFLARACGGDEALRREVESLVSYGGRAEGFIEGSALELVAPALARGGGDGHDPATDECWIIEKMIGKRVSQYRIVEQLGRGGMGEVYRAVRADDQYQKQVAIKLVRTGEDSGFVIDRFKNERQILASLDHPNIARLLDGGATDEGVPYFVMDLVEGQPIDQYCDSHKLGIPARLKLFLQVCSALAYAHQHQIIHRDIKPSNILVTEDGVPKLLDFGIAKILDSGALAGTVGATQTVFRAFTPEYASPEQVKAEPIGAASDVYSLGILLYELLTGHRPYRFKTRTPLEIERAICEEEPLKPSAVVTRAEEQTLADGTATSITAEEISNARGSDPKQMQSRLLGDLDAVVMMALRKEPHRRYASADALADDIRKHLEGLPITARPSTMAYRGAKFIRRHRELAVGALVSLVLLGGLSIWEARQAGMRSSERQLPVERQLTRSTEVRMLGTAISPDGRFIAYTTTTGLHLSSIETGEVRDIPLPEELRTNLWFVSWFPDNQRLLLSVTSESNRLAIWLVSTRGGTPRKIRSHCEQAAVSPDGSLIALACERGYEVWLVGPNGENPRKLLARENEQYNALSWSPTGQHLAYFRLKKGESSGSIETISLDGQAQRSVFSASGIVVNDQPYLLHWLPDGRMIFVLHEGSSDNLWEIMTDPQSGEALGRARRITNWDGLQAINLSASRDGRRLVVEKTHRRGNVYLGELKAKGSRLGSVKRLTLSDSDDMPTAWALDGKSILFSSNRTGRDQVYRQSLDQESPQALVPGVDYQKSPVPSPDGAWIFYWSSVAEGGAGSGRPDILSASRLMRLPSSGGPPEQVLEVPADDLAAYMRCSPRSGGICVLSRWQSGELFFYALDPAHGQGTQLAKTKLSVPAILDSSWVVSADGARIAMVGRGELRGQIRVLDLKQGTERNLQLPNDWYIWDLCWMADGKALLATAQTTTYFLARVELDGKSRLLLDRGRNGWLGWPVLSPDGRHLAFHQLTFDSNAWLLEDF